MGQDPVVLIIHTVGQIYAFILILRFLLQVAGADYYNPISQAVVRITGGPLKPLQMVLPKAGRIDPKTRTSRRRVPMPAALRELLLDRRLEDTKAGGDALGFGRGAAEPFHAATLYRRADSAWKTAGLGERLRLHQARHTYASFMIAAGINAKALAQFMGHSSIKVTFDLYGHLMPGSEREAAGLLDAFLERASSQARMAGATPSLD